MKKSIKLLAATLMIFSIVVISISNISANGQIKLRQDKNIVDIAISDGRFTTLVEALKAANLVETLQGKGPFTVFAPTDEAFSKLPQGTIESLLKPSNKDTLKDILLYHVAKGNLSSKDVLKLDGKEITLENGKTAKISVKNGEVYINDSKVIITDIKANNGIIHVIDTVLIPK